MRPGLRILDDELIVRIVDEAKRVLAEVGMEIRGPEMKRRLLEHGLPLDHSGTRVLFPRDVVDAAASLPPRRRSRSTTARATRTPSSAATTSTSCPARRA